jgi:predicted nucleic acid-binding protein
VTDVFLVDKSALARVPLQPAVRAALEQLDDSGLLATSPIIDLEIGYSARNLAEFESVAADRRALYQELPLTPAVTDRARAVQRDLVASGQHRGPGVADLLIAATAQVYGAIIVHYDHDFDVLAEVTGQPARWIVTPGSVP